MPCKICDARRPRRFCPGVNGEICSVCCGTGREETVSCPLDCAYLREARTHEKPRDVDPKQIPNVDIEVTDSFLHRNEPLLVVLMHALAGAMEETQGAVDFDAREALDALARTYRTLQSGLYYETKPSNLLAVAIQERVQRAADDFRKNTTEHAGLTTVRDADVLGALAFLQRVEYQVNNGRKRGRAFLDFLHGQLPESLPEQGAEPVSPLLKP
jgi:hypothetical protein